MIKVSTFFLFGSIVLVCTWGAPHIKDFHTVFKQATDVQEQISVTKKKISETEIELNELETVYGESISDSNYNLAKFIADLPGVKVQSIISIVTINNEPFECSEIDDIEDVIFFNDRTEQMLFKLKITNLNKFVNSLTKSPISISRLCVKKNKQYAELTVSTVVHQKGVE